jgi:cell division septum initiation protein DivIVA
MDGVGARATLFPEAPMKITPLDVQQKRFERALRGYERQ